MHIAPALAYSGQGPCLDARSDLYKEGPDVILNAWITTVRGTCTQRWRCIIQAYSGQGAYLDTPSDLNKEGPDVILSAWVTTARGT